MKKLFNDVLLLLKATLSFFLFLHVFDSLRLHKCTPVKERAALSMYEERAVPSARKGLNDVLLLKAIAKLFSHFSLSSVLLDSTVHESFNDYVALNY
jgi:hypothetical protein